MVKLFNWWLLINMHLPLQENTLMYQSSCKTDMVPWIVMCYSIFLNAQWSKTPVKECLVNSSNYMHELLQTKQSGCSRSFLSRLLQMSEQRGRWMDTTNFVIQRAVEQDRFAFVSYSLQKVQHMVEKRKWAIVVLTTVKSARSWDMCVCGIVGTSDAHWNTDHQHVGSVTTRALSPEKKKATNSTSSNREPQCLPPK